MYIELLVIPMAAGHNGPKNIRCPKLVIFANTNI